MTIRTRANKQRLPEAPLFIQLYKAKAYFKSLDKKLTKRTYKRACVIN